MNSELFLVGLTAILTLKVSGALQFNEIVNAAPAFPYDPRATCQKENSKLTAPQKKLMVDVHNNYRRSRWAVNMRSLSWGSWIAPRAQALANTCNFQHGMLEDCSGNRLGQNLYAVWGNTVYPTLDLKKAVLSWFNEYKDYSLKTNSCNKGEVCGHYTQVVWAETSSVGCGYAKCPSLTLPSGEVVKKAIMVACNYKKAGNTVGVAPFLWGKKKCAKCPAGTKCKNKLCGKA